MKFFRMLARIVSISVIISLIPINVFAALRQWHPEAKTSKLVYYNPDGEIQYSSFNENGDILPDYSHVGYMGGDIPIPDVPVKVILEKDRTIDDDTGRIQKAIDEVSAMEPDSNGIRGAVLLKKGRYNISSPLNITTSGVVVRGEGMDENGTVIFAKGTLQYTALSIIGGGTVYELSQTKAQVTDKYVPVGTYDINVEDVSCYSIGDDIILRQKKNQNWIDELGMGKGGVLDMAGKTMWTPESYIIDARRRIVDISGNRITLDVPVVDALDMAYSECEIVKIIRSGIVSKCGIENIRFESEYDTASMQTRKPMWNIYADTNHPSWATGINNAENCWIRKVTSQFFVNGVTTLGTNSRMCTVEDSEALDPVSPLLGGYRYSFSVHGQQHLVKNCYGKNQRHDFTMGAAVPGPNVFYNCVAENAYSPSETHQRWTCGVLYDNVTVTGPGATLAAKNRGNLGSGQGWTGNTIMFWNCLTAVATVEKPPIGQNFVVGVKGPLDESETIHSEVIQTMDGSSLGGVDLYEYNGIMALGDAYFENTVNPSYPQSLYLMQYDERQKGALSKLTDSVAVSPQSRYALIDKKRVCIDTTDENVKPYTENGIILAPIRFLASALGSGEPQYDESTGSVKVIHDGAEICFSDGSDEIKINGYSSKMSAKSRIHNGRMYVPVPEYANVAKRFVTGDDNLILIQSHLRKITSENAEEILNMINSESDTLPVITSIRINGNLLKEFKPETNSYIVTLPFEEFENIKVEAEGSADVKIYEMDSVRNTILIEAFEGKKKNFYLISLKAYVPDDLIRVEIESAYSNPDELDEPDKVIDNSLDGKFDTSWVTKGEGLTGIYTLEGETEIHAVGIAFLKGNTRQTFFELEVSNDGVNWQKIITAVSNGETEEYEIFNVKPVKCKYIKYIGNKNSSNDFNNVSEFCVYGR